MARQANCRSREIASAVRTEILQGIIPLGSMLPSVRILAERYGVGPQVIVSVLQILEQHRLIQRFPRRGIRVVDRLPGGKILIVTSPFSSNTQYMIFYLLAEVERLCKEMGLVTDRIPIELLRNGEVESVLKQLSARGYSGILLCEWSYIGWETELALLRSLDLPVVMPLANVGDQAITGFAAVENDLDSCWKKALDHLAKQGYKKIGAVGKLIEHHTDGEKDSAALGCHPIGQHFRLMEELSLEVPEDPLLFLGLTASDSINREKIRQWLRKHERLDAVVLYTSFLAPLFYEVCQGLKIRIPQDLAIAGVGIYPGFELLSPPLTMIGRTAESSAASAVNLLWNASDWFKCGKAPVIRNEVTVARRRSTKRKDL